MAEAVGRRMEEAEAPAAGPTPGSGWSVADLPVADIHERRWRNQVDVSDPAYRALHRSIGELGIIRPLVVRPRPQGGYELVSGARRLRAARDRGWRAVPAVVRELSEAEALVGGAWQPLMRSGCSEPEAAALREELVGAGMTEAEAEALTAILGFRPPGEVSVGPAAAGRRLTQSASDEPVPAEAAASEPVGRLAGRPPWAWTTRWPRPIGRRRDD